VKNKKREYFQEYFSGRSTVDLWEDIYKRGDIGSFSVQERMRLSLAWSDALGLEKDSRVLDAGCGAGLLSREMSSRGYDVFGVDYSFEMLQKAASVVHAGGGRDVSLVQGNVQSLSFKSSSFDLVVSLGVISYLPSFEKAIAEFFRILKPSGVLIFSTMNKVNLVGLLDIPLFLKNQLKKIGAGKRGAKKGSADGQSGGEDQTSKRFYFTPWVIKSLRGQGFTDITYRTIPYRPLTFLGRKIPPNKLNLRIVMLVEKLPAFPAIGPLGGLCLFIATKPANAPAAL
jgi:ubiquinone/menaquinone biosynthesis C-methylase UbiE